MVHPLFSISGGARNQNRVFGMGDDGPRPTLENLDSRLKEARGEPNIYPPGGGPRTSTGRAIHLGIEMAATMAAGVGIGWALDYWLDTKPWLLVVFVFIGIGAGIRNALRIAKQMGAGGAIEVNDGAKAPENEQK